VPVGLVPACSARAQERELRLTADKNALRP